MRQPLLGFSAQEFVQATLNIGKPLRDLVKAKTRTSIKASPHIFGSAHPSHFGQIRRDNHVQLNSCLSDRPVGVVSLITPRPENIANGRVRQRHIEIFPLFFFAHNSIYTKAL